MNCTKIYHPEESFSEKISQFLLRFDDFKFVTTTIT